MTNQRHTYSTDWKFMPWCTVHTQYQRRSKPSFMYTLLLVGRVGWAAVYIIIMHSYDLIALWVVERSLHLGATCESRGSAHMHCVVLVSFYILHYNSDVTHIRTLSLTRARARWRTFKGDQSPLMYTQGALWWWRHSLRVALHKGHHSSSRAVELMAMSKVLVVLWTSLWC